MLRHRSDRRSIQSILTCVLCSAAFVNMVAKAGPKITAARSANFEAASDMCTFPLDLAAASFGEYINDAYSGSLLLLIRTPWRLPSFTYYPWV
jgi:hypothetical protein